MNLWALGRYDLKLGEDEFWELTLRELMALMERFEAAVDWMNYRSSIICAVIANAFRDTKKRRKAFTPWDFIPAIGEESERQEQTPTEMFAQVKMWNAALGGSVVEV